MFAVIYNEIFSVFFSLLPNTFFFRRLYKKLQNKTRFSAEDLWTNFLEVLKDKVLHWPKQRNKWVQKFQMRQNKWQNSV